MLAKQVQQYEAFGTVEEITELGRTAEKQRRGGDDPWGVATFMSSRLFLDWFGYGRSVSCGLGPPEALPLLGQPAAPIVTRVVEQPLAAPKPTHAVGHRPLRPPLLAHRVRAHPLAQVHLEAIGDADYPDQPVHHRGSRKIDYRRSHTPAAVPVTERLFDRHTLSVLGHRLCHRRRGGEQHPGLGIALGHDTWW